MSKLGDAWHNLVKRPYPNEHACRLRPPSDFQAGSFRRGERKHKGKIYYAIYGRLKGEKTMTEQAYRYPKDEWTEAQARAHCQERKGRFEPARKEEERATRLAAIWVQVGGQLAGLNLQARDFYLEDGALFIIADGAYGQTYRVPLVEVQGAWQIGTPVEVEETFNTTALRTRLQVVRQADGGARWFAVAAAAVLNRVGEIDSRDIFDDFVTRFNPDDPPALDFFHTDLVFGQVDFLARDGALLLASGTLERGNPLSEALVDALEQGRGRWGCSIAFEPDDFGDIEEVAPGVKTVIYRRGTLRRIAVLPERFAASHFTDMEVKEMDENLQRALEELFGDVEKAREFIAHADDVNRAIAERGLVVRTGAVEGEGVEDANVENAGDMEGGGNAGEETAVEGDWRELLNQLTENLQALQSMLEEKWPAEEEKIAGLERSATDLQQRLDEACNRLAELERSEEEKRRQWVQDIPARQNVPGASWRPRQVRNAGGEESLAEVAARTLENLKR